MARRRLARGCPGGGAVVQAAHPARSRVGAAAAAVASCAAFAAWLALAPAEEPVRAVNLALGAAAVALLVAALLVRLTFLVPVAVALVGGEYALLLLRDAQGLDGRAPFLAAGLWATAELAYWTLELRDAVADEPGTILRRVSLLAGGAILVVGIGLVLLTLVEVAGGAGSLELLGAAAAVAALALLAVAARSSGGGDERS